MKKIFAIVTLVGLATTLSANDLDWNPFKRKRDKNKTVETVATDTVVAPAVTTDVLVEAPEPDTIALEEFAIDTVELNPQQLDSLLALWHKDQDMIVYEEYFQRFIEEDSIALDDSNMLPDSIYQERLNALASPIPLAYNHIVKGYINRYTKSQTGSMSVILGRSQHYFPMMEQILLEEGLPVELCMLAVVESALSATAVSRAGAAGLWQFMPRTGKYFGLQINSLIDQRRDPILATRAACKYLKYLYGLYNDWSLALAAYNCGPGNVNKAIARSGMGDKASYWNVYDYLPRETRGYVPAFIGATYAYHYHKDHGIRVTEAPLPVATDTLQINRILHLEQVASSIDVPIETLRMLNPQYKLDIIPATKQVYALTLPQQNVSEYIENESVILAKDSLYLKEYINPTNLDKRIASSTGSTYVVKSGDVLGSIARRHGVTVSQIMRWNNLKSAHKLRIGQRLRIEK